MTSLNLRHSCEMVTNQPPTLISGETEARTPEVICGRVRAINPCPEAFESANETRFRISWRELLRGQVFSWRCLGHSPLPSGVPGCLNVVICKTASSTAEAAGLEIGPFGHRFSKLCSAPSLCWGQSLLGSQPRENTHPPRENDPQYGGQAGG